MITCGYWDYFEYGCDYLKKYDSDFINPYIERYANGDFTENENKVNQEINTDYMINFAQKCLKLNEKEMDMLEDKIIDLLSKKLNVLFAEKNVSVGIKKVFIPIFGKKKNAPIAKQR